LRHFAILTLPDGHYACTANPDGTIPLSSRAIARNDATDRTGANLRQLVDQANAAHELAEAMRALLSAPATMSTGIGEMPSDALRNAESAAQLALTRAGML
jgi:predicted oxidoreductase